MGNLYQEHRFRTDGDGLAQWTGGRLEQLKQRGSWESLDVQLGYMIDELNTTEKTANNHLKQAGSVEAATIAFQNKYERCGMCLEDKRINYALDIYNRNK